jgi:NAD(P)-dependent dehydrogenase (short-subunit alcohol dehydrogenase family)
MSKQRPTALVTGASRGLGLETCRQLGNKGLRVILTARNEGEGRAAAGRIAGENIPIEYRHLDVTSTESVAVLAQGLAAQEIELDVLVNNAAIALDGFNAEVARRTIDTNFFGPMRVTDGLLTLLSDGSKIVMVSSGVGEVSDFPPRLRTEFLNPALNRERLVELMSSFVNEVKDGRYREAGWPESAYRVSKAGLNALTRILALEFAGRNIQVNAVCPGWVRTNMGGQNASRTVEKGAASIVWAALLGEDGPTGGFFRDGRAISW